MPEIGKVSNYSAVKIQGFKNCRCALVVKLYRGGPTGHAKTYVAVCEPGCTKHVFNQVINLITDKDLYPLAEVNRRINIALEADPFFIREPIPDREAYDKLLEENRGE